MSLLLLCSWSAILIFIWMVWSKYYWTKPPFQLCMLFMVAGLIATIPALFFNMILSSETKFWVYSLNPYYSFLGFFASAGLGEEFWKMGLGILLVFILSVLGYRMSDADYTLGFVCLGLTFASYENLISYSHLGVHVLILRGFITIPLHGGMGMIHGMAVVRSLKEKSMKPLLIGYFQVVVIHTFCDTWSIFYHNFSDYTGAVFVSTIFLIWGYRTWSKIEEIG